LSIIKAPIPGGLLNNSAQRGVWEGYDFSHAVKSFKTERASPPGVRFRLPNSLLRQSANGLSRIFVYQESATFKGYDSTDLKVAAFQLRRKHPYNAGL
jgi:hypothetical protein